MGRPLSAARVWRVVTRHTRRRLGVAISPHLFRDCAATLLGDVDPTNVLLAAPLLRHGDFRTSEGHLYEVPSVKRYFGSLGSSSGGC